MTTNHWVMEVFTADGDRILTVRAVDEGVAEGLREDAETAGFVVFARPAEMEVVA